MSAMLLKDMIDKAPEAEIEPPRPLQRPLEPADPFPMEALGSILGDAALAIVDKVQCPEAIAGQSVLAAATLAVQAHADIELPQGSTAPLSNFFLTVACSGDRKSTADRKALWPIGQREKTLRAQHDDAMPAYMIRQASWEASRKQILSNRKLSREAKHAELEDLGPAPEPPLTPLLTCPSRPSRVCACSCRAATRASACSPPRAGSSLAATACPRTTASRRPLPYRGSGMGSRSGGCGGAMGWSCCLDAAWRCTCSCSRASAICCSAAMSSTIRDWCRGSWRARRRPPRAPGSGESPGRRAIVPSDGTARASCRSSSTPCRSSATSGTSWRRARCGLRAGPGSDLIAFMDHVERQLDPSGPLDPVRAFANKMPEHAARLAGVLALVEQLDAIRSPAITSKPASCSRSTMPPRRDACRTPGQGGPELVLARRVLEWLARRMVGQAADLRAGSLYLRAEPGARQEDRQQDHRHPRGSRLAGAPGRPGQSERHDAPRRLAAGIRGCPMSAYQRFLPRDGMRTTAHVIAEVAEAAEVEAAQASPAAEALLKPAEVRPRDLRLQQASAEVQQPQTPAIPELQQPQQLQQEPAPTIAEMQDG